MDASSLPLLWCATVSWRKDASSPDLYLLLLLFCLSFHIHYTHSLHKNHNTANSPCVHQSPLSSTVPTKQFVEDTKSSCRRHTQSTPALRLTQPASKPALLPLLQFTNQAPQPFLTVSSSSRTTITSRVARSPMAIFFGNVSITKSEKRLLHGLILRQTTSSPRSMAHLP